MQFPITSAYGNLVVGALAGTGAAIAMDVADDHGVSTMGQVGIGLGIGLPMAMMTRGHTMPYIGGAVAASLGVGAIMDAMEK
jgi:hypothetical protein